MADESVDIRFLINSPEVEQESARVQSSVSGIEKAAASAAKGISQAFSDEILNSDDVEAKVKTQKAVLKELESSYESLRKKVAKMPAGNAKVLATQELTEAKQEIDSEKIALEELTKVQEQFNQSAVSMRTRIRNLKEDMAGMVEGTDEYTAKMLELGDLQDRYGDVSKQGQIFADDQKNIRATTEAIQGISGAMSAAVGVASLLGASEENLTKIQTRLQAVMAISVGVNQVAQVLNKDSYFTHIILTKAKNLLTVAQTKLTAALWGSTVAAKAFMGAITLGASVIIGVVVSALSKLQAKKEEQKRLDEEAAQAQEQYYKSVSDSVSKQLAEYRKLQGMWNALNGDSAKQQKFLKAHADKFKELGVKVSSAKDAENLLINNEARFIQSLMNKARAAAAMELAAEKYKTAVESMIALEDGAYSEDDMKQARKNVDKRESGATMAQRIARQQRYGDNWLSAMYKEEAEAIAKARLNGIIQTAESEADKIIKTALKNGKTADQLLAEAGITPHQDGDTSQADALAKYKEAILKSMQDLEKSRVAILKDGKEKELRELDIRHRETLAQIEKDRKDLEVAAKASGRAGLSDKEQSGFTERETNAYQSYVNEQEVINEKYRKSLEEVYRGLGDVFLTEEERKRAELQRTYDKFREQAKKMFEGGDITEEQYIDLKVRIDKAEAYEGVRDLLPEFRNYEEQRLEIAREYNEKIAALEAANTSGQYDSAIAEAKKQRDQALAEFDSAIEDSTSLWSQLFDSFAHYTNQELQSIVSNAREVLDYVSTTPAADIVAKFGLTAEQLRSLKANADQLNAAYDAMGEKLQQMHARNPFSAMVSTTKQLRENTERLTDAKKRLAEAEASGDKKATKEAQKNVDVLTRQEALLKGDLKDAAKSTIDYLGGVGNSLQAIGEAAGDTGLASVGKMLSEVSGIAGQLMQGDYIGAAITAITTGLTAIFSSRSKYRAALRQMKQDLEAFAHEYKLVLADIELAGDKSINIFSEDAFERAITALRQVRDFYDDFLDKVNERQEPKGIQLLISRMKEARGEVYDLGTKLENIKIVTRHKTLFRSEKSATLKELYPKLFEGENGFDVEVARALLATNNQLNEEQKRQIQEVVDLYDQMQEAEEQFKEYLSSTFGEVGNSLADSIVTAFEEGTDAMENWGKSFNNVLKNLGKQLMQTLFFQKHFDQLEKDLTNLYGQFGDDPKKIGSEVQDLFGSFFSGMSDTVDQAEQWYANFADAAKKNGFDLSGDGSASKSGTSGQLQAQMTEGTASQLVGLWNITAMEIRQVRELTTGQLAYVTSIRDDVGNLLVQVILIERNTRETAENTAETVRQLSEGFTQMNAKLTDIEKNTKPNNSRL